MAGAGFNGFSKETYNFMWELGLNNNREWYGKNKDRHKAYLKEPMELFAKEMIGRLNNLNGKLKFSHSISRINRDIRFSKNKEPYRANKWVEFRAEGTKGEDKPVFYFEVSPQGYSYGVGYYDCRPATMKKFRDKIDANEAELRRLIKIADNQKTFTLIGDKYKRILAEKPPEILEWYQRKNLSFVSGTVSDDFVFSGELVEKIEEGYELLMPIFNFLY